MAVALDQTLRTMEIKTLLYKGMWSEIVDRVCNGADIYIGAGVTEFAEATEADIGLCAEVEALLGFVIGLIPQLETIPALGMWFNDYDNPFANNTWVRVGIPKQGNVILILSDTNVDISKFNKIKCVDGVWQRADTNDNYQMIAIEDVVGAANTRVYFYGRWVKN